MPTYSAKAVRSSLWRKLHSHFTGIDPSTATLKSNLELASVVATNDKKFPLHVINDDPTGWSSNSGGSVTVGDQSNPDDNFTRKIVNSHYTGTPASSTDTVIYTVTSGKTLYLNVLYLLKTTAEQVIIKDGVAGSVKTILKPGAASPNLNQYQGVMVFQTAVVVNQATSEASLSYDVFGVEQ